MTDLTKGLTLGILGGGQLGRMSALAAAQLGIDVITFTPEQDSPASRVSRETIIADYIDKTSLKKFSDKTDFITYEFENIPIETIDILEEYKPNSVFPSKKLLEVAQDRITEKSFSNDLGIQTTVWKKISCYEELEEFFESEFILKTSRFGYDGKGQYKHNGKTPNEEEFRALFDSAGEHPLILEHIVAFKYEISMIVARDTFGNTQTYGPMLNEHKNHILHKTHIPANISETASALARDIAKKIADALDLQGVLTVEFFVTEEDKVLLNEIAPRTHNSGHWTINACATSQFENHVRAVCGLPILPPSRHSDAEMLNIIGENLGDIDTYLSQENANIHLYGKRESRPDRKMGHITFLKPKS
ncbi:MAG: 5-(carboxyamino)imidazole ribonucleotide synthase [Alphaproteobacteria bacterium]|nr:5-(carboxyamino)imidazole ribonucleotide synthase [Alphaproteobacteria bacterium]